MGDSAPPRVPLCVLDVSRTLGTVLSVPLDIAESSVIRFVSLALKGDVRQGANNVVKSVRYRNSLSRILNFY